MGLILTLIEGALSVWDVNAVIVLTFKTILMPAMTAKNNSVDTERRINALKKNGIFLKQ
jgi:hypothetical protein